MAKKKKTTKQKPSKKTTTAIKAVEPQVELTEIKPIKCEFVPRPEFICLPSTEETKTKLGSYHGSSFTWNTSKRWTVGVYIKLEAKKKIKEQDLLTTGLGCVKFINETMKAGKRGKKKSVSLYGNLEYKEGWLKKVDDGQYIIALLTTDDKNNNNFWGKGK